MKTSTIALIVVPQSEFPETRELKETLSDEREIQYVEEALRAGEEDPLEQIYQNRELEAKEEDELGNYIEDLLSQPYVKPEIQGHAVQWLKSKIKIERYQKAEKEASQVIAQYAYRIYQKDPTQTDFLLAGPNSQVRVRIFELSQCSKKLFRQSA